MSAAWTCPACGRGVAPSEKTCDHGGQILDLKGREFLPPYPRRSHGTDSSPPGDDFRRRNVILD